MIGIVFIISIGVGAITTAIDIATDTGMNTDGTAEIDLTSHVVATIDIVDVTTCNEHTGCQIVGEIVVANLFVDFLDIFILTSYGILSHGTNISHTAAAVEIVNHKSRELRDFQENTLFVNHTTTVTTTVQVADHTVLQVPGGTDGHIGLVIAAIERTYLEFVAAGLRERGVDTHIPETCVRQEVDKTRMTRFCGIRVFYTIDININMVHHLTGVIHMDDCFLFYRYIVTTAIGIHDASALHIEIGLLQHGRGERRFAGRNNLFTTLHNKVTITVCQAITIIVGIGKVTITAGEDLTDIDLLSIISLFFRSDGILTFSGGRGSGLGTYVDIGIPRVVNTMFICTIHIIRYQIARQRFAHGCCRADGARDIITAIDLIDNDIAGGISTVDVDIGIATHISHTGTTEHLTQWICQRFVGVCRPHTDIAF